MPTEIKRRGADAVDELISGQGGTPVQVRETRFTPDEPILDPNSPLAVQIPEGVGADHSRVGLGLAETLAEGHVEAKFGTAAAPVPTVSDGSEAEAGVTRAGGDDSGEDFEPDWDRVETQPVHNEPQIVRDAAEGDVAQDVEAESAASSKGEVEPAEDDEAKAARADERAQSFNE